MKDENKRTLYLKVRVSPEEMDAIKCKFQNSGMDSLSGFVRAMIFEDTSSRLTETSFGSLASWLIILPTTSTRSLIV